MSQNPPLNLAVLCDTGWLVRVWVGQAESDDPAYETALYMAGFATPAEAEEAVRKEHPYPERVEVLPEPITPSIGPQPEIGEVQRLKGAV